MLSVKIKKRLGKFGLDVAFETKSGTTGILGASGCGKSMTLRCIAGIEQPDEGRIVLADRVLYDSAKGINLPPQARRVGYLFQNYALFPNMNVVENITAGARHLDKVRRRDLVSDQISRMHLDGLENLRPAQLSGGQQQRVALARILVGDPELLLLDEPFAALDDYLRWQLELELADVLVHYSRPAIFVSHNRGEIYRLCDQACILSNGRSEEPQPVGQLFTAPKTLSAAVLAGCKNFSRAGRATGGQMTALDWGVTLPAGADVPEFPDFIGVHAHALRPALPGETGFGCRVERVVENVSGMILMMRPHNGQHGSSLLRMDIGKVLWNKLGGPTELLVHIRPQDILLLKDTNQKGGKHDQGN